MIALVTGGTGFVGSAVVRELLNTGCTVRALVRPTSDRVNLVDLPVQVVTGSLADKDSLLAALGGCTALFHVAADYRLWSRQPGEIYHVNVEGTVQLMTAALAAGVERIVYTSSVATMGSNADRTPADEDTPVSLADMVGHYKRSKFLAETEVRRLVQEQGLPAVIVNPSTPAGPRDIKPTPTGRMILEAVRGWTPAYVNTGLNVVHVDDVAQGHVLAYEWGSVGERYILGGKNMSLKEILTEIASLAGRRPPLLRLPHNLVMAIAYLAQGRAYLTNGHEPRVTVEGVRLARKYMYFSSAKAKHELGYAARPARDALVDAVRWFQES